MQQSVSASNPNDRSVHNGKGIRGMDIPGPSCNGHRPSSTGQDTNGDIIRNISLKRLGVSAVVNTINNNLNHNSNASSARSDTGSPLNLSVDADDSRPDSSVENCDSKVGESFLKKFLK